MGAPWMWSRASSWGGHGRALVAEDGNGAAHRRRLGWQGLRRGPSWIGLRGPQQGGQHRDGDGGADREHGVPGPGDARPSRAPSAPGRARERPRSVRACRSAIRRVRRCTRSTPMKTSISALGSAARASRRSSGAPCSAYPGPKTDRPARAPKKITSGDRHEDQGHAPERGPGRDGQAVRVEGALDRQRHRHVDGEHVDGGAEHPGHVEVRVGAGSRRGRDDDRHEVAQRVVEERAGVVAGEVAADLPAGGDRPVARGLLDVPGIEAALDEQPRPAAAARRADSTHDTVMPSPGSATASATSSTTLRQANSGVLAQHPGGAAQPGEHAVLRGEQAPRRRRRARRRPRGAGPDRC